MTNAGPTCPDGDVPAASVFQNQKLYDALVDAFSMRGFVPSAGVSGHDQFFATFDRFGALDKSHAGEWLDEVATRAAAQNEQYLEVMQTPSFFDLAPLWNSLGWPATPAGAKLDPEGDATGTSRAELDALRTKLLAGGLRDEVALDAKEFDEALASRARIERCGEPDAAPACAVKIRFLYQVLRAFPPQQVFAQTLLAFEVASADPNVVGLNFVQPEDATALHERVQPADAHAGLSARIYPQGSHLAACGRACAGAGAAGRVEVPHPRGGRAGPRGADRARRGCDAGDGPARAAARDGRRAM